MCSDAEVVVKITEMLSRYSGEVVEDVCGEQNFVTSGWLDSFALLSFITDVEERFDIQFTADELSNSQIQTVAGLCELVTSKRAGSAG
ncbi:MAG: acyl carrier protein [Gammaproteobacteria bacterium]|nr:acyl carrier protein [Gammaproteobacteria bacterium]